MVSMCGLHTLHRLVCTLVLDATYAITYSGLPETTCLQPVGLSRHKFLGLKGKHAVTGRSDG